MTNFLVVTNILSDQYFYPTKISVDQKFYQLFFLLNKNQIQEILKKLSDLLYHILAEWRWAGKGS